MAAGAGQHRVEQRGARHHALAAEAPPAGVPVSGTGRGGTPGSRQNVWTGAVRLARPCGSTLMRRVLVPAQPLAASGLV